MPEYSVVLMYLHLGLQALHGVIVTQMTELCFQYILPLRRLV